MLREYPAFIPIINGTLVGVLVAAKELTAPRAIKLIDKRTCTKMADDFYDEPHGDSHDS